MKCPNCGWNSPESTQRCGCGYDFNRHALERSCVAAVAPPSRWHLIAANAIIAVGLIDLATAFLCRNTPGVSSSCALLSIASAWRLKLHTMRGQLEQA